MEFESNQPTTQQDVTLADAPRMTVQPLNQVTPDMTAAPAVADPAIKRTFEFEAESTAAAALSHSKASSSNHRMAMLFGGLIALLFGGALAAYALLR